MLKSRKREIAELVGKIETPIAATLTTGELAELLNISARNVDMLASKGILEKAAPAKFDTRESIAAYLAYARRGGNTDLDAEKLRLTREQADKVELQNAQARRELVPATEVERTWSGTLRDIRAAMLAVPARVGQRASHLTAHDLEMVDREIRDALVELAGGDHAAND